MADTLNQILAVSEIFDKITHDRIDSLEKDCYEGFVFAFDELAKRERVVEELK